MKTGKTGNSSLAALGRRAVLLGVVSTLFSSVSYVVNNRMALAGGSWMWSASLRYGYIFLALLAGMLAKGSLGKVLAEVRRAPLPWLVWSTVGFGVFYAPLTFAAAYGPSWLVAGTFQFTILAGALMSPLFYTTVQTAQGPVKVRAKIPLRLFPAFFVIIAGVFLLQLEHAAASDLSRALLFAVPVLVSAFAYPLGNRKTMELCADRLTTMERVFGMTLCSMPFWLVLAVCAGATAGAPPGGQLLQTAVVAVCAGLLATPILFHATRMVRGHAHWLALVESTQCGEVVFSLAGGILLLHNPLPGAMGWTGLGLVAAGMVANSLLQEG